MPRLSIHLPDGSEKTIVLPKNGEYFARIGRDEHCEIVLPFQSVSGEHALLQFKEGGYVLEDLGSTNGTKINGLTPMGAATLYDGDEIALGGCQAPVCGRAISGIFCRIIRERRRGRSFDRYAELTAVGG